MSKRLFLLAFLVLPFIPLAANADDLPAPVQPDPAAAATLGPAANAGPINGSSSGADSGTLQGASTSPLQSTQGASTGLVAPSNALQGTAAPDQTLRVIMGEADGNTHSLSESSSNQWAWLAWTVLIAGVAVVGAMLLRRFGGLHVPLPRLPQIRLPGRRPH
jgi:hypothetical protein